MQRISLAKDTARSILLATILAAGLMMIWLFLLIGGSIVYQMFIATREWRQLVFTVEGQPLWQSQDRASPTPVYRSLDGKKIEDSRSLNIANQQSYNDLPAVNAPVSFRTGWSEQIRGFLQADAPVSYWYLIHDGKTEGHAYLAGYDPITRQLIGYLGKAGFQSEIPVVEDRFGTSLSLLLNGGFAPHGVSSGTEPYGTSDELGPIEYLVADGELWSLDFKRQAVQKLSLPGKVMSIATYDELTPVDDERKFTSKTRLAVRFAEQVGLYDLQLKPLQTISLPAEVRDNSLGVFRTTSDQVLVVATPTDYSGIRQIYWFDPQGSIARHETTPPVNPASDDTDLAAWVASGACPMPVVLAGLSFFMTDAKRSPGAEPPTYWERYAKLWGQLWLPFLLLTLMSLALAIYCYRRQRAYAAGGAVAWAVFVLLTGLPGLIGYLVHRHWPARVTAPAPQAPPGIEVFA